MPRLMSISSLVLAVFVTLPTVSPLLARQSTLPLTLENIYGNRHRARQGVLSPDGQWVAVTANGPEGNGIYLVSTQDAVARTGPLWVRGRSPAWFPASRRVAFVRDGDLWAVSMGSSDAVPLTNDEDNERAPVVSPDGRWVAFYSSRSGHQDIWVVSAEGGEPRAVTTGAYALDDARWAPAWSPDSREIAYVSNTSDYWADDVWVVDVESGQTRQISSGLMASTTPVWSPDGSRIALLGTSKDGYWYEDLADIFVLDPLSGAERTVEMQVHATDWLHRMPIFWSGDGEQIYFLYQQRGDFDLWAVPSAGGVATRVTNMGGSLSSVSATATADAFAFVRATPTRGPDLDYLPATGGRLRRLTTFADEWSVVVDPEEISYRSFDGLYIQGFLYLPPGRQPEDRHPTLVHVHGGGTNSYLHGEGLFEQYFAQRGTPCWPSTTAADPVSGGRFRTCPSTTGPIGRRATRRRRRTFCDPSRTPTAGLASTGTATAASRPWPPSPASPRRSTRRCPWPAFMTSPTRTSTPTVSGASSSRRVTADRPKSGQPSTR